jgi:hypothetical protein
MKLWRRDNMIDLKCPCGKEGKYLHFIGGEQVISCNKYNICKSYDDLQKDYDKLKSDFNEVYKAALGLSLYREGTDCYEEAMTVINNYTKTINRSIED